MKYSLWRNFYNRQQKKRKQLYDRTIYVGGRSAMENDGLEAEAWNTDPGHAELVTVQPG